MRPVEKRITYSSKRTPLSTKPVNSNFGWSCIILGNGTVYGRCDLTLFLNAITMLCYCYTPVIDTSQASETLG